MRIEAFSPNLPVFSQNIWLECPRRVARARLLAHGACLDNDARVVSSWEGADWRGSAFLTVCADSSGRPWVALNGFGVVDNALVLATDDDVSTSEGLVAESASHAPSL